MSVQPDGKEPEPPAPAATGASGEPASHPLSAGGQARPKSPVTTELVWSGQLRFNATSGPTSLVVDGDSAAGPSPMKLVAMGLAGCMAIDVLAILQKGRQPVVGLRVALTGERTQEPPRRFTRFSLAFDVTGAVDAAAVEHAIALSREKYCSVWESMRQDIELTTSLHVQSQA